MPGSLRKSCVELRLVDAPMWDRVGVETTLTYHVVACHTVVLPPSVHDERVVVRQHGDLAHAERLELLDVLEEAGHVAGGAGRCESTGNCEEDDLLAREFW